MDFYHQPPVSQTGALSFELQEHINYLVKLFITNVFGFMAPEMGIEPTVFLITMRTLYLIELLGLHKTKN